MEVAIPNILALSLGTRTVRVDARTVREALDQLRAHPKLGPLIFDESKHLRRHVLMFVNDTAIQHLPSLDMELSERDRISVVQSVSGG